MSQTSRGGEDESVSRPLRVAVFGSEGRMGRAIVHACEESPLVRCTAAISRSSADGVAPESNDVASPEELVGTASNRASSATVLASAVRPDDFDVLIEFTRQESFADVADWAVRWGKPWVSGTTGLTANDQSILAQAAESIPVLWAPNMSLGIALLGRMLREAARLLPATWQMELVETHHPAKVDAPSGTALALAEVWRSERGGQLVFGREGQSGPRPADEIGVHARRLPRIVGEHQITLGSENETLELEHRALDRAAFVDGALEAARWVAHKETGLFTLDDWARDRLEVR